MSRNERESAARRMRAHLDATDWSTLTRARRSALEAFLRLSNRHGFSGVTMRMLGKELDIKAPSLYAYFPDGRNEIVSESLRWHFSKFGYAVLDAVEQTSTADDYWDALIRTHLTRQIELPESDLWDLLVAADAIVGTLPAGLREQTDAWVAYYEALYAAAAKDMGVDADVREQVQLILTVVEGARRWTGSMQIERAVQRASEVSRALLRLPSEPALVA